MGNSTLLSYKNRVYINSYISNKFQPADKIIGYTKMQTADSPLIYLQNFVLYYDTKEI